MRSWRLPSASLLATQITGTLANNTHAITTLASTGSGPEYASACASAISAYSAESSAWAEAHHYVSTGVQVEGGTSVGPFTIYENATTLCDGHPRVTSSPAVAISSGTTTVVRPVTRTLHYTDTYVTGGTATYPSCKIAPTDCDPLWTKYYEKVAAAATITPPPKPIATPPCANQSVASQDAQYESKIRGCGKCTIYADGVQLVYFPTTASRDMCATIPTDTITHYGKGAVITAYAGTNYSGPDPVNGARTAVVDGHTFTSGTAYISIERVFALDRCTKTYGNVISNVILAMPSESVLSLRYSQSHYQLLHETAEITGYPVSYADFNKPIPWSAWNGQNQCEFVNDETRCGIIYENDYRPQLAIPPEITSLSPNFEDCQMWYNGLWDPPLALNKVTEAARPTLPSGYKSKPQPASPPSSVVAPTITTMKLADEGAFKPAQTAHGSSGGPPLSHASTTAAAYEHGSASTAAAGHDVAGGAGASHGAATNGDDSHKAATNSDAGHEAATNGDGSHKAAPDSNASHEAATNGDAGHNAATNGNASHAGDTNGDASPGAYTNNNSGSSPDSGFVDGSSSQLPGTTTGSGRVPSSNATASHASEDSTRTSTVGTSDATANRTTEPTGAAAGYLSTTHSSAILVLFMMAVIAA